MQKIRLRWNGNQEAQRQADEAFEKLRDKPKRLNRKQRRRQQRLQQQPAKPTVKLDYYRYIDSAAWRKKRTGFLSRHSTCEVCGTRYGLQVHHRHYRTLGKERDGDLMALCAGCHSNHHEGDKGIVMDPMTAAYVGMFRDQ